MFPADQHIQIGTILFDNLDQIDLTGPYEVLATIPNSTFTVTAKSMEPMRDFRGLRMLADKTFTEVPQFDVLHIPGGPGQEALMEDEEVLSFLRTQASGAQYMFSVCTGALVCGAAGLLVGRKATTHWSAHHLLPYFGAEAVNERVVIDGNWIFAAGVTSGIDGALQLAAILRGQKVAEQIQLYLQYHPEPPFDSGTPERAPKDVLEAARNKASELTSKRLETAKKIATRLEINPDVSNVE